MSHIHHHHAPSAEDTPRSAMSLLHRRVTWGMVAILAALSAIAWWSTVDRARSMAGMVGGLGQVGRRMPYEMSTLVFLGMWVAMMVAMMFPTIAPMVLAHRMVITKRGEGPLGTVAFVGGYLLVWTAIGLIPLAALVAFREFAGGTTGRWLPAIGGVVLILAGAYQFTTWKAACLRACRTPLSFLMTHDFRRGSAGAFRAGISHGSFCLGCCWALMAVLVIVGLMNLVWMAVISVIFLAEKNWRHGVALTKVAGTALAAFGIVVVIAPGLLATVSDVGPSGGTMQTGGMNDGGMNDGGMNDGGMNDGGMNDGGMNEPTPP